MRHDEAHRWFFLRQFVCVVHTFFKWTCDFGFFFHLITFILYKCAAGLLLEKQHDPRNFLVMDISERRSLFVSQRWTQNLDNHTWFNQHVNKETETAVYCALACWSCYVFNCDIKLERKEKHKTQENAPSVFPFVSQNGRNIFLLSLFLQIRRKVPSVFCTNPSVFSFRFLYKSFRFFLPFFLQIRRKVPSVFRRKEYPWLVRLLSSPQELFRVLLGTLGTYFGSFQQANKLQQLSRCLLWDIS